MVRAFVGIAVPEDIKRYVIDVQNKLKSLPIKAKFVEPENLHISLSFLGDIEDDEIEKIKLRLNKISESYDKFKIIFGGIHLIPNKNLVRVIAIDIKSDDLESLRKEVVVSIGGKSYPAHLTLARVNAINDNSLFFGGINKIDCKELSVEVTGISLIASALNGKGPTYTILYETHLK